MVNKLCTLAVASVLAFTVCAVLLAPQAFAGEKAAKEGRWEGMVARTNPDKSTLVVREVATNVEKTVQYDSSTKWVSQEHGKKTVNDIDASQVKENDRVICKGTWEKDGVLHATLISKRLTN